MSRLNYVIATDTVSLREPGSKYPTTVRRGTFWWADCPMVRDNPDLFSDAPPEVEILPRNWPASYVESSVEQATAAPGEKRSTRRAKTSDEV